MPADILEVIFLACLSSQEDRLAPPSPSRPPLQLMGVCSHWRSVGTALSSLWEDVYLDGHKASSYALAELWITRSRRRPSLYLETPPQSYYSAASTTTIPDYEPFLAFLASHCVQFRRLSLPRTVPRPFHFSRGKDLRHLQTMVTKLVEAHCTDLDEYYLRGGYSESTTIPNAAKVFYFPYLPRGPLPLTKLRVLWLNKTTRWSVFEGILYHCPLLEKFLGEIQGAHQPDHQDHGFPSAPEGIIRRGALKQLSVGVVDYQGSPSFPNWEFPSLHTLEIVGANIAFFELICNGWNVSKLRRLTIVPQIVVPLTRLFEKAELLEEIVIFAGFKPSHLLPLSTLPSDHPHILPKLKHIHIAPLSFVAEIVEIARAWSVASSGEFATHQVTRFWIHSAASGPPVINQAQLLQLSEAAPNLDPRAVLHVKPANGFLAHWGFQILPRPYHETRRYIIKDAHGNTTHAHDTIFQVYD